MGTKGYSAITWQLHGCPRCGGDIFIDGNDKEQPEVKCLQCGYTRDVILVKPLPAVNKVGRPSLW
jgi:DNA-directed RNA polymerase subunit RPC12/RpoP